MRRLLYLWLALLGAYWAATATLSTIALGRIDQGEISILAMVAIPIVQALALGWLTRAPRRGPGLPLPAGWAGVLIRILVVLDLAIAMVGGLLPEDALFSLNNGGLVTHLYAALQALAAAGVAAALARRKGNDRLALAMLAAALGGYAIDSGFSTLSVVPARLAAERASFSVWLGVHTAAALAGGALLLYLERRWRADEPRASRMLEIALGLGILAGFGSVLGMRLRPEVGQPIFMFGCLCGFLAITEILAALLQAISVRPATHD
ncbi:MAG: hypothetical protein ABJC13_11870 [Acidobacteriota bacterium]